MMLGLLASNALSDALSALRSDPCPEWKKSLMVTLPFELVAVCEPQAASRRASTINKGRMSPGTLARHGVSPLRSSKSKRSHRTLSQAGNRDMETFPYPVL